MSGFLDDLGGFVSDVFGGGGSVSDDAGNLAGDIGSAVGGLNTKDWINAGSTAFTVFGAGKKAQETAQSDKYNADQAEMQARVALDQMHMQLDIFNKQTTPDVLGGIAAARGASGISADSSSAAAVMRNSAANLAMDASIIQYRGNLAATGQENIASLDNFAAGNAMKDGQWNMASQFLLGVNQNLRNNPNYTQQGNGVPPVPQSPAFPTPVATGPALPSYQSQMSDPGSQQ